MLKVKTLMTAMKHNRHRMMTSKAEEMLRSNLKLLREMQVYMF